MSRAALFGMVGGMFLFGAGTGAVVWGQTAGLPDPAPAPAASTATPAPTPAPSTPPAPDTDQPRAVDSSGPTVRSTFDDQDLQPDHPTGNDSPDVSSSFDREDKVDEHPVP